MTGCDLENGLSPTGSTYLLHLAHTATEHPHHLFFLTILAYHVPSFSSKYGYLLNN